ncbi:hypothetical protein O6H91_01G143700 [Diphasiastrum complanatum]|uniref:Uncharacterized protein n=2 Tax=Diphasiastrum complanatum TaxID=34168 RepID=A0ACC2EWV8_DIPCM|nr:hypothetical protein O6H91_01G143700 [Diphasiastrum complanatum]
MCRPSIRGGGRGIPSSSSSSVEAKGRVALLCRIREASLDFKSISWLFVSYRRLLLDHRHLVRLAFIFFVAILSTALLGLLAVPKCKINPWPAPSHHHPSSNSRYWDPASAFPRCSMDLCFNFSRCHRSEQLLIYSYNSPQPEQPKPTYMHQFPSSIWHTSDPEKACLLFYFSDSQANTDAWIKPKLSNLLPYWNNGLNHVIISFADRWSDTNPPSQSIGMASILATNLRTTTYRPHFDISIPLPRLNLDVPSELGSLKPFERKYFLTFKGTRYLSREGNFRSSATFRNMHNGVDVIVATTCKHETNDKLLRWQPWRGSKCDNDQVIFDSYDFLELLNSTFGLVPAGRSPASYRMLEVLSVGMIPILIVENYLRPFNSLIQWQHCLLQFSTSEMHLILPTLRKMPRVEVEARQRYCQQVFDKFLKDDNILMNSVIRSLKDRFVGRLPNFVAQHTI